MSVHTGLAAGQRRGGDQSAGRAAVGLGADHAAGPPWPCARSVPTGAANAPYRPVSRLGARIEASRGLISSSGQTPTDDKLAQRGVVRRHLQTDLGEATPDLGPGSSRVGSRRLASARVGSCGSVWVGSRRTGVRTRLQPRSGVSVPDAARPEGVGQTWLDRLASFGGWSTQKTPHCMRAGRTWVRRVPHPGAMQIRPAHTAPFLAWTRSATAPTGI
jgi:hypothetical protein